jgi:hypothetical protein
MAAREQQTFYAYAREWVVRFADDTCQEYSRVLERDAATGLWIGEMLALRWGDTPAEAG